MLTQTGKLIYVCFPYYPDLTRFVIFVAHS